MIVLCEEFLLGLLSYFELRQSPLELSSYRIHFQKILCTTLQCPFRCEFHHISYEASSSRILAWAHCFASIAEERKQLEFVLTTN